MSLIGCDRDFRLFWIGETTSRVGSNVTTVVMPLVAVTVLHSGAFTASALTAAAWLPWLVFGLGAGPAVDRSRKRRLMIICDVISAVLFASVPIAGAFGLLSAGQLLIVAFGAGCVSVLFTTAYSAFLVDLVPGPADRAAANSTLQGSASAAQVAGPGFGGLLVTALGAVTALLADSVSFVISAICLLTIGSPDANVPTTARRPLRSQIADGVRFLSRDRLLRPLVLFGGTANLALVGYQALMVVFLVRVVGLHAGTVGLVMGLVSCGGVIGAFAGNALARWLGSGRALLLTKIGACPFALFIPLAARGWREAFVILGGCCPRRRRRGRGHRGGQRHQQRLHAGLHTAGAVRQEQRDDQRLQLRDHAARRADRRPARHRTWRPGCDVGYDGPAVADRLVHRAQPLATAEEPAGPAIDQQLS